MSSGSSTQPPPTTERDDDLPTMRNAPGGGDSGRDHAPDTERDAQFLVGPGTGDVIAGRWIVEHVLGSGGMGRVLAVRHKELGSVAAIKVLSSTEPDARSRFAREARAMATLTSRHTVRVHDVGKTDDGTPYMVMECLEGADLAKVLKQDGPPRVVDACVWMEQACEAVEEAHGKGIIHRDLKPQNLFLAKERDGKRIIRVLDFGIARRVAAKGVDTSTLTQVGAVVGTLAYMAPEQIRSPKDADARSDVWSLGACLYRILSGKRPFEASSEFGVIEGILHHDPKPLREQRPDVPAEVEAVVAQCLRKEPGERFLSAAELRIALERARTAEPATEPKRVPDRAPNRTVRQNVTVPITPEVVAGAIAAGRAPSPSSPSFPPMPGSLPSLPSLPQPYGGPSRPRMPSAPVMPAMPAPPPSVPLSGEPPPSTFRTGSRPPSLAVVIAFAFAFALFLSGVVLAVITALSNRR